MQIALLKVEDKIPFSGSNYGGARDVNINDERIKMLKNYDFPILIEKDEDGFYVAKCPVFRGCYSQGKTLDEALKNIKEVIDLCLEEKEAQNTLKNYHPQEFTFHTLKY